MQGPPAARHIAAKKKVGGRVTNDADKRQEGIEAALIYTEIGKTHRYFLDWRNKIVGGYLAVLGALGLGYENVHAEGLQIALLFAAGGVSFVFWIFDFRNRELYSACQRAGADIEEDRGFVGPYRALQSLRKNTHHKITHGLAINLLVAGVVVGVSETLYARFPAWLRMTNRGWCSVGLGVAIFVLLVLLAELLGAQIWDRTSGRATPGRLETETEPSRDHPTP